MKAPIFSAYAKNVPAAIAAIEMLAAARRDEQPKRCRRCFGSGIHSHQAAADCKACNGTGQVAA